MRHDLELTGFAFRLRPIGDADASFVVALRGDPAMNRYIHAGSSSTQEQQAWLAEYYTRAGDYYFVIERNADKSAEGLVAIYNVDAVSREAEWGRWILTPGSLAAVESAWLVYRIGFEALGLAGLYCRTAAENASVVSFHDSCGVRHVRRLPGHFHLGGRQMDAIEHRIDRAEWPELAPRLEGLAKRMAERIARA